MKTIPLSKWLAAACLFFVSSLATQAQLVINEFDADTTGSDKLEFVELYDGGVGNTSLDGHVIVFYNGSSSSTARGAYQAFDLDDLTTDADGYFLLANPNISGIDTRVAAMTGKIFDPGGSGALQNGEDAIALYSGVSDSDFNLVFTEENPRTLPSTAGGTLLDAVVYNTSRNGSPDPDSGLIAELGIDGISLDENANENKDFESWARVPDGGNPLDISAEFWTLGEPTAGGANVAAFELELEFSVASVNEGAGANAVEVTLIRDDGAPAPLLVLFDGLDPSELGMPEEVTMPAGMASFSFFVDVPDDGAGDGTVTLDITASSVGFFPGMASIDIVDDGDSPTLVINEIYAEVEGLQDPNGDGITNFTGDEFVEIVNISGASLDISGWELSDLENVRHVFAAGTVLDPDCAVVVFGGGDFSEGIRADFGSALVLKASSGALGLNDGGDTVTVREAGIERAGALFSDYNAGDGDLTRVPELTGPFVTHPLGTLFSPGVRADSGASFCILSDTLSITGTTSFSEDAGVVGDFTVMRSGDTTAALTVTLSTSDASEAIFSVATVVIPAGQSSAPAQVEAVDDPFVDGTQGLELIALAPAHNSGYLAVSVSDSGADSSYLLINEADIDTPGSDQAEFIELYDGGIGNTPLDGYVVVLYNGANDEVYDAYDLDGKTTNAQGFFVIGAPGVPNVGLTDFPGSTGFLQNGSPDAIAIHLGSEAEFFEGAPIGFSPVDAIIYGGTGAAGDTLGPALGLGIDRVGKDNAEETISRLPDGGGRLDLSGFGDGIPTPGAANVAVGGASAYDTWAAGFPGIGSQLDDDDCDGLTTLMEYALGKNPLVADRDGAVMVAEVGDQLQLTISKGAEAAADTALSYVVESSTDQQTWSTADTSVLIDDASTLSAGYTGAAGRAYLRLRVTLQ